MERLDIFVISFMLIGIIITGLCMIANQRDKLQTEIKELKKQAIELGFAEYKTSSDGVVTFEWKKE